mgnify:CR=1 FL=1
MAPVWSLMAYIWRTERPSLCSGRFGPSQRRSVREGRHRVGTVPTVLFALQPAWEMLTSSASGGILCAGDTHAGTLVKE